ncbi:MAG: leucine-rich repeat domain-containing protein [Lachnospiraceae bacterium]|nr:leucine-rich repeat domain-containing protein [Lachnospiraceae bacterium]
MKQVIRRAIAVLLCVTALILIFIPSPDSYASTVRGDYEMDGSVIVKYLGNSDRITIPDTVTKIGKDAFSGCTSIVKVTLPDSVSEIGYSAFENCINLEEISVAKGVRVFDSSAFSGCTRLSKVNIPEKTRSLGSGVFAGCSSLSDVTISPDNRDFVCKDGVIYSKDGKQLIQYLAGRPKTSYSMPAEVQKIGEYAFWGANNLTDVSISKTVKTIPEYAFANCGGLTNVVLPYGVQSLMAYSFADCNSLRNIVIPDTVSYIDVNAFASSKKAGLDFENGNVTPAPSPVPSGTSSNPVPENEQIPDTDSGNALETTEDGDVIYHGDETITGRGPTTTAGPYPYLDDYGETKILGGNALVMLSKNAPVRGYDLENAETEDDVSESGTSINNNGDYNLVDGIFSDYKGPDTMVRIPDETERIGNRAFYMDEDLSGVTIPDSVTEIGDFAFAKTPLTSVEIPPSVTDIGYAAFYQCPSLLNIGIPASVKNIELGAFEGTAFLNNWYSDPSTGSYFVVGDGILLAYKGDGGNITIPDGVKTIGSQCFYNNRSIKGVSFPDSVTKIGEEAFNGCSGLSEIELPPGLSVIEDRAFMGTALKEVVIPASVKSIGIGAFDCTETEPVSDAVFLGNELPRVSYKTTASRLSAGDLRTPAFNGVKRTGVSGSANLSGPDSVAAADRLGIRGQIFAITDQSTSPGTLELKSVLDIPDSNGSVLIDSHASFKNRDYVVTDVSSHAFDNYGEEYYYNGKLRWAGAPLKSISVNGNNSEALNSLLSQVYTTSDGAEEPSEYNAIKVLLRGDGFSDAGAASAVIPGSVDNYVLTVNNDESRREIFEEAISNEYGTGNFKLVTADISLSSMMGNVNITKFGTSKLELCLPVPDKLRGETGIKAACLNDNLVYEPLAVSEIVVDNVPCIRFVASHMSPFAFFVIPPSGNTGEGSSVVHVGSGDDGSVLNIEGASFLSGGNFSVVMETLNKKTVGSIEAKWFIIVILLCLSMILFLIKDKKRR